MVISESDDLWADAVQENIFFDSFILNHFFKDEQMPLLVVLLKPGFLHEFKNQRGWSEIPAFLRKLILGRNF